MLWEQFISGDPVTGDLIEEEFIWMRRYAFLYSLSAFGDEAIAEDFAHTALERVLSRLQELGEITRSYYRTLVRYLFLDTLRNRKKDVLYQAKTTKAASEITGQPAQEYIETLQNHLTEGADDALFGEEIRKQFTKTLNSMDFEKRRVVVLRIMGISAIEISRELGSHNISITPNHIGVIYHGFKKLLRKNLIRFELQLD